MWACDECMRRTWLLDRVSAYLQFHRKRVEDILTLDDEQLIALWANRVQDGLARDYEEFDRCRVERARAKAEAAGLELICRCDPAYPERLLHLRTPPAVLHVAGGMARFLELAQADPVALVGSRRATGYGQEIAHALGRGCSASGLCVVSGMAIGADACAHRGALAAGGHTVAVLAGGASDPYPKANRGLHGQILASGAAVSEFGPGTALRGWTFIARNRIIAGLARLTAVVQGRADSGALCTAAFARGLGRPVGAVPGAVSVGQSEGPNGLLAAGAVVIRDAQDVLNAVFGAGVRDAEPASRAGLDSDQLALLEAIANGDDTAGALTRAGVGGRQMLVNLAELELAGCVRRAAGGRYIVTA